jgi:hypothetical protein
MVSPGAKRRGQIISGLPSGAPAGAAETAAALVEGNGAWTVRQPKTIPTQASPMQGSPANSRTREPRVVTTPAA